MPTDAPVEDRIMENVIATLLAITAGTEYYSTTERVHAMQGNPLTLVEMPAAIVQHMSLQERYGSVDQVECDLRLAIALVMQKDEGGEWQKDIRRLATDAKRALRADFGRGTFGGSQNAFDTYI